MANKFGKFVLFSAVAGAAAYGAYYYLHKKEQSESPIMADDFDDDFDDFSEDLDEDLNTTKERTYVSLNLDRAEAFATEAFHKAKEVISDSVNQVKETVKSVTETQVHGNTNFTDLTNLARETATSESTPVKPVADATDSTEAKPAASTDSVTSTSNKDTVEDFFDDDDDPSLDAM